MLYKLWGNASFGPSREPPHPHRSAQLKHHPNCQKFQQETFVPKLVTMMLDCLVKGLILASCVIAAARKNLIIDTDLFSDVE